MWSLSEDVISYVFTKTQKVDMRKVPPLCHHYYYYYDCHDHDDYDYYDYCYQVKTHEANMLNDRNNKAKTKKSKNILMDPSLLPTRLPSSLNPLPPTWYIYTAVPMCLSTS